MELNLETALKHIPGRVICVLGGEKAEYTSGKEAFEVYGETGSRPWEPYYIVEAIRAEGDAVILDLKDIRPEINKRTEEFEREHFEQFGVYPDRFDGA